MKIDWIYCHNLDELRLALIDLDQHGVNLKALKFWGFDDGAVCVSKNTSFEGFICQEDDK